jgi:hypothetical protein
MPTLPNTADFAEHGEVEADAEIGGRAVECRTCGQGADGVGGIRVAADQDNCAVVAAHRIEFVAVRVQPARKPERAEREAEVARYVVVIQRKLPVT